MDPIAPPRSRPGQWWDAVIGAGPIVVGLLFAAVLCALVVAYRWLDPTPDKHLVIATGPEQGAYVEFAKRYLPLLRAQGLTVTLRTTQGSAENLALLRDPHAGVQAAFVQSGVDTGDAALDPAAEPAAADASPAAAVMSLGSVAYEPIWLFYREASAQARLHAKTLDNVAQLAGWRVNTGPAGAGAAPLFRQLAAANHLDPARMQLGEKPSVLGVVDLLQGRTDALVLVAAGDAPLVQYLLRTPGVRLFEFTQADAYARRFGFLHRLTLLRGMIDLARDDPPHDVPMLAATASLVVRQDLHPALVQLLVQAAQQVHGDAGWFNSAGEFPNASTAGLPLSPEARRFYRDGVPWLQRYLPFWLANFIERMWIVVLPLLALLIPLSRIVPPLVTLRMRSRVYRWYAHLRAIEHALDGPAPALDRLQAEIDRIDAQAERIGLPLSFTHELYALRTHIQLVRQRIVDRAVAAAR
jgi:TRAP-type uncharacterized transport system substrate-binding protein